MTINDDQALADLLCHTTTIALLGASHKPDRPSYRVMQFLLDHGFKVVPVNPKLSGTELLGQKVYARLSEVPCPIDMVDVFRNSSYLRAIVDEVINLNIGTLWTQLGVIDEEAALHAEANGVQVVMNKCPAIEWPRLKQMGLLKTQR